MKTLNDITDTIIDGLNGHGEYAGLNGIDKLKLDLSDIELALEYAEVIREKAEIVLADSLAIQTQVSGWYD